MKFMEKTVFSKCRKLRLFSRSKSEYVNKIKSKNSNNNDPHFCMFVGGSCTINKEGHHWTNNVIEKLLCYCRNRCLPHPK